MALPEWDDPDRRDAALIRVAQRLARPDPLTKHELAVLFLLSHGVPQVRMAEILNLSPSSIKAYIRQARTKLYAATSEHAVATALRLGLIS